MKYTNKDLNQILEDAHSPLDQTERKQFVDDPKYIAGGYAFFIFSYSLFFIFTDINHLEFKTNFSLITFVIALIYQIVGYTINKTININKKIICDLYFFDFWSLGHLLFHACITCVVYYFTNSIWIIILLNLIIWLIWELFEIYMNSKHTIHQFYYCESRLNALGDLFFGMIGMTLTLVILCNSV